MRQIELPSSGDRLKLWLTVIEYCEVFCELSAKKLWGNGGKWLVIVAIQVFKYITWTLSYFWDCKNCFLRCLARLFLVYHHRETIIQHPPIPPLQRSAVQAGGSQYDPSVSEVAQAQLDAISFTLKRSGRIVRKIDSSPPVAARTWKGLERSAFYDNEQTLEQALAGRQLVAETIYVLKPLVHLGSIACFGEKTWKPWMVALLMDLSRWGERGVDMRDCIVSFCSLHLYRSCSKAKSNSLTKKQKLQVSRRTLLLLMYIFRSPFYDKHSRDRVHAFLLALSKNVPLIGIICNPIMQYLPYWQGTYFYMWSTWSFICKNFVYGGSCDVCKYWILYFKIGKGGNVRKRQFVKINIFFIIY